MPATESFDGSFIGVTQAETQSDFEEVRRLRNLGAMWFENTAEVTSEQQEVFRQKFSYPIWLYRRQDDQIVGYGFVTPHPDGKDYLSLAVDPKFQGYGYGTMIHRDQRIRWPGTVWAYARRDNVASCRAAVSAGYIETPCENADMMLLRGDHLDLPEAMLDNG